MKYKAENIYFYTYLISFRRFFVQNNCLHKYVKNCLNVEKERNMGKMRQNSSLGIAFSKSNVPGCIFLDII